jgi:hypothetical protein
VRAVDPVSSSFTDSLPTVSPSRIGPQSPSRSTGSSIRSNT